RVRRAVAGGRRGPGRGPARRGRHAAADPSGGGRCRHGARAGPRGDGRPGPRHRPAHGRRRRPPEQFPPCRLGPRDGPAHPARSAGLVGRLAARGECPRSGPVARASRGSAVIAGDRGAGAVTVLLTVFTTLVLLAAAAALGTAAVAAARASAAADLAALAA